MLRILGLDPGLRRSGWAFLEKNSKGECRVLSAGVLCPEGVEIAKRLAALTRGLCALLKTWKPDEVAVEDVFFHKNAASSLKLGMARGALLARVGEEGCSLFSYAPRLVKETVSGRGNASKEEVALMLVRQLRDAPPFPSADASDAAAVAFCHSILRAPALRQMEL